MFVRFRCHILKLVMIYGSGSSHHIIKRVKESHLFIKHKNVNLREFLQRGSSYQIINYSKNLNCWVGSNLLYE